MQFISLFLRKATIPFFVFITGGCVLVIEIVAIRILSPYYGNTIFAVSSVLSVVLGALSCGYYAGGKLADYKPSEKLFYSIIAVSGFLVILLYLFGTVFLSLFGYSLSITEGPLISSFFLFFLQSFFLGMLSPFAIKLQTMRLGEIGIGSASGQIFFWSTLGSITGSLLAGFYLIPAFGISSIMLGTGFLLVIMGLFSGLNLHIRTKWLVIVVILVATPFFTAPFSVNFSNMVYVADGVYQKISIFDDMYNGRKARFLLQDRNASAAMFLDSDEMPFEYTKYYALYQLFNPSPKNVFCIGGGAYSVPKALLSELPQATIDVAEIEPSLINLARQYFNLPNDPRLRNLIEDGRRLLVDSPIKYDFIFSDAYASLYSTPGHLATQEFFVLAKSKLTAEGVFIANVIGNLSGEQPSLALSEMKTFKSIFENSRFFAVTSPDSKTLQNMIFVGYNGTKQLDLGAPSVTKSKNPVIAGLAAKEIDVTRFDFSLHPLLTDNFAPVEYFTAQEIKHIK